MINGKKSQMSAVSGGLAAEVLSMFSVIENCVPKRSVGEFLIQKVRLPLVRPAKSSVEFARAPAELTPLVFSVIVCNSFQYEQTATSH